MAVTVWLSSDIVGGIVALILAAAGYTISSFAYPRLMAISLHHAAKGGWAFEASTRSTNSVRNWFGFWTMSLTVLYHVLSLSLEFGLVGVSTPVTSKQSSVILGGGRRFSNNHTADGDLFMHSPATLPPVFAAAVGGCYSVETHSDFKMIKNLYPAIEVSQNFSGTYVNSYETYECTSSWLGSAEWTVEPTGNLTVDLDSVTEQYRYQGVSWTFQNVALYTADMVSISFGYGTSVRGEAASPTPAVLVNVSGDVKAISVTEENGHYVYSLSTSMEYASNGGREVITGTFTRGHFRSSEYSMGGMVSLVLAIRPTLENSLVGVYSITDIWWESEARSGDFLSHSNPEGSEQLWPSLPDGSGNLYVEYKKAERPIEYPFKVGATEITRITSWFFALATILALTVVILSAASLRIGNASDVCTYDGLSRMIREEQVPSGERANPTVFALLGVVGNGDSERVVLIQEVEETKH